MANGFSASVWKEGDLYVAQCLEIDIASQGVSEQEALGNLREAVELFFECADSREIARRVHKDVSILKFEAARG